MLTLGDNLDEMERCLGEECPVSDVGALSFSPMKRVFEPRRLWPLFVAA